MDAKRKKFGFTLAEILTVLGIIALLVGLLLPALSWVHNTARETKQKAQLTAIGLALTTFKNDYGDYPPSDWWDISYPGPPIQDYCGAQKLAEALLGRDLLGFHPKSTWSAADPAYYPPTPPGPSDDNLSERRGPYLELATANAFRLGNISVAKPGLFDAPAPLAPDTFVICDVFGVKKINVGGKIVKAGTPILYYRANTSSKSIEPIGTPPNYIDQIYNIRDNGVLVGLGKIGDVTTIHPLWYPEFFYGDPTATPPVIGYIQDPKVTARPWPYRPDSYILISAGADGLYGTSDDITNFGN